MVSQMMRAKTIRIVSKAGIALTHLLNVASATIAHIADVDRSFTKCANRIENVEMKRSAQFILIPNKIRIDIPERELLPIRTCVRFRGFHLRHYPCSPEAGGPLTYASTMQTANSKNTVASVNIRPNSTEVAMGGSSAFADQSKL